MFNRKPTLDKEIEKFLSSLKDNKTNNAKKEKILYYYNRVTINSGAYGCIFEIMNSGTRKKAVAKQGKNDIYFTYNGKRVKAENKTNGGRIGDLLNGENSCKFVVYSLDLCNKGPNGKHRHLDPVIIPTDLFIDLLERCNAIKAINRNGEFDDFGIQCSSKKLYEALLDYPIVFTPTSKYTTDDFDGIEI